ncbi:AlbA family DNA-binding domain-containing protein [Ornithinimicrobium avium]|uniref:AlbA family DNA-binding domain-containing protein n=1 Tax=Ornithinimicrobium avium TaxID=2283195 RepID=UPI0013B359C5|nr:ATP-binding protein [Ornithinimicrobium avium]
MLDFALIERACAESLPERTDLDWKRQLPLTAPKSEHKAKQAQQIELAKDIAAMANSGGGMIVYGISETTRAGTSAAETIVPVGIVDETITRDVRRVAGNLVYPPVVGLDLIPLAPQDDAAGGVLVLLVPDSADRPHLVHPSNGQDWFGAPYRHGPDTEWMVERQIAAAYTERQSGRRRQIEEFDTRFAEFTDTLAQGTDLRWVVAYAVPDQPSTRPMALSRAKAHAIIEQAWASPITRGFAAADITRSGSDSSGAEALHPRGHPAHQRSRLRQSTSTR